VEKRPLLHARNRHQGRYDFVQLIKDTPELAAFVVVNPYGEQSINFANPAAVKVLNRALLNTFYGVAHWDIPAGYLCPPIPGRADYVHYMADLLAESNAGVIPRGAAIRALDIGVGANGIYPLIGHREYGWRFLGTDIDATALASVQAIVQSNDGLVKVIELRQQHERTHIFRGLLDVEEYFDLTLCNPPFHASLAEAHSGSERKWRGLGRADPGRALRGMGKNDLHRKLPLLNFGGQNNELWCEGGEALFVRHMIEESAQVRSQFFWFSTLISKESNLPDVYRTLKKVGARDMRTVEMAQGQKKSRFVAWTFLDAPAQKVWRKKRWLISEGS
jgi:23S rRNA (adenine1618-N6)-methyltransferase